MGQNYWQEGTRLNIGGVKVRILEKRGDNVNQKEFDDKTIKEQYKRLQEKNKFVKLEI